MGKLKDEIVAEDEWVRHELTEPQYNYLKNMHDFCEAQKQYLEGLQGGLLKLLVLELGYEPTDKLAFDVDFDDNRIIKVRKH